MSDSQQDQPWRRSGRGGISMVQTSSQESHNSQQSAMSGNSEYSAPAYSYSSSSLATSPDSTYDNIENYLQHPSMNMNSDHINYQYGFNLPSRPMDLYPTDVIATGEWSVPPYHEPRDYPATLAEFDQHLSRIVEVELRHTTKTMRWTGDKAQMSAYTFRMPKGGFPHFELHHDTSATSNLPEIVHLEDQDSQSRKGRGFTCKYPMKDGVCRKKNGEPATFNRAPDLERHYKQVHVAKENRTRYTCDYATRCERANKAPISRKDHLREHYRDNHREDLSGIWKRKEDPSHWEAKWKWWASRIIDSRKWRCEKCLFMNKTSKGWDCKECGSPCDEDRVAYRDKAPFGLACGRCYGAGFIGLDPCDSCQPSTFNSFGDFDESTSLGAPYG